MKLLNESCKFQCMLGNPSILITASEQGNTIMKDKRRRVLTVKAKCQAKTPLPCSFLTAMAGGTPTNCQLSQMEWLLPNSKIKCNGNMVLTDSSSINCIHGGLIKPILSNCVTNIGFVQGIEDIGGMQIQKSSSIIKQNAIASNNLNNIGGDEETGTKELKGESVNVDIENEKPYASHTLCDYENCDKREECEYFKSQIYVENDSSQLKSNFLKKRSSDWQQYYDLHRRKNIESNNGGWRIAAHHMISGNQVLMMKDATGNLLYGEIVKLANFFGYDVNNEWNCIMLPTNESGFGELEQVTKYAIPYDVMWTMGRQWHVGGHEYRLDKDTLNNLITYYKKNPEQYPTPGNPNFFVNYKEAMKEEMNLLLLKYSKCICWKRNYNSRKEKFFADMNALSKKVEKYLLEFGSNPRKSFPFFVSKISVEYAYDLPATSKLIVIYKMKNKTRAKRIRLERYMKNGLKIIPIEKADIEIGEKQDFIIFCENVMHFYIDAKLAEYTFPFNEKSILCLAQRTVDFGELDVMKYLCNNSSEMMAFINQNEFTYQPISKVINERGG